MTPPQYDIKSLCIIIVLLEQMHYPNQLFDRIGLTRHFCFGFGVVCCECSQEDYPKPYEILLKIIPDDRQKIINDKDMVMENTGCAFLTQQLMDAHIILSWMKRRFSSGVN